MKWMKLGRVFVPRGDREWMASHAANPVADPVDGDRVRIYFSPRDAQNRSCIAWLEVDMRDPLAVTRLGDSPVLSHGATGAFDDSGCSMGCVVRDGRRRWLYYMGWNLGVTVPWRNAIGLAHSEDAGETFTRASSAPVLDRSDADPYTISYPWVLRETAGWRMWYGSNLRWGPDKQADMDHRIKSATSSDGRHWNPEGRVLIEPASPAEYAFARPCVVPDGGRHRMWFAYRGASYRIGYAESEDGTTWRRGGDALEPTPGDWDGESVEYPSVFEHAGRRYMLYCGNGYGRTGFGIAVETA